MNYIAIPTDYGLPSFRVSEKHIDCEDSENRSALLKAYKAPEVRGLSGTLPNCATDTYRCAYFITVQVVNFDHAVFLRSYAIILLEVALRMDPYTVSSVCMDVNMCTISDYILY